MEKLVRCITVWPFIVVCVELRDRTVTKIQNIHLDAFGQHNVLILSYCTHSIIKFNGCSNLPSASLLNRQANMFRLLLMKPVGIPLHVPGTKFHFHMYVQYEYSTIQPFPILLYGCRSNYVCCCHFKTPTADKYGLITLSSRNLFLPN